MTIPFPIHIDFQAGDITCCNGGSCCISSKGGGAITINHNLALSKSGSDQKTPNNTNQQNELEDKSQYQSKTRGFDAIINSPLQTLEDLPRNLINRIFKIKPTSLQKQLNKVQLLDKGTKQAKQLTPAQNRTTIQTYYDNNAKHYTPTAFAFLAAYSDIKFDELYNKAASLPAAYDKDIQNAIVTLKPLWPIAKNVVDLINELSQETLKNLNSVKKQPPKEQTVSQKEDPKDDKVDKLTNSMNELTINLPNNIKETTTKSLQLFLAILPKLSTLQMKDLTTFRKQARLFELLSTEGKNFEGEKCNFTPFKKGTVSEIVKISSVIDTCMKKEKKQTIEEALTYLATQSEEALELLVINK